MTCDPIDALDALEDYLNGMLTWCDQNGNYDTGIVSVSHECVMRMRRLVHASCEAIANGSSVEFPNEYDAMSYLVFNGGGMPTVV